MTKNIINISEEYCFNGDSIILTEDFCQVTVNGHSFVEPQI